MEQDTITNATIISVTRPDGKLDIYLVFKSSAGSHTKKRSKVAFDQRKRHLGFKLSQQAGTQKPLIK